MINICEMDNGESIKGLKILFCLYESLIWIVEREIVIKVFDFFFFFKIIEINELNIL